MALLASTTVDSLPSDAGADSQTGATPSAVSNAEKVQIYIDRFRAGAIKTHAWFQPDGSPTFVTHPMNSRRHQVVQDQHGESFLKHGVVPFVSGAPWTVWSAEMSYPLQCISWATRCRAFYAKLQTHGNNPRIQDPPPDRQTPFQDSTPDRPFLFRGQLLTDPPLSGANS